MCSGHLATYWNLLQESVFRLYFLFIRWGIFHSVFVCYSLAKQIRSLHKRTHIEMYHIAVGVGNLIVYKVQLIHCAEGSIPTGTAIEGRFCTKTKPFGYSFYCDFSSVPSCDRVWMTTAMMTMVKHLLLLLLLRARLRFLRFHTILFIQLCLSAL